MVAKINRLWLLLSLHGPVLSSQPGNAPESQRLCLERGIRAGRKGFTTSTTWGYARGETHRKRWKDCFGLCEFLNELGTRGKVQNPGTLQRTNKSSHNRVSWPALSRTETDQQGNNVSLCGPWSPGYLSWVRRCWKMRTPGQKILWQLPA